MKIPCFLHISFGMFTLAWSFKQVWTCKSWTTIDKV